MSLNPLFYFNIKEKVTKMYKIEETVNDNEFYILLYVNFGEPNEPVWDYYSTVEGISEACNLPIKTVKETLASLMEKDIIAYKMAYPEKNGELVSMKKQRVYYRLL